MANATTFPIKMNGADLQFGDLTIPLKTGTSYWADKQNHQISVCCCPAKDYHTTFKLFLENGENMHACIREFMKNTEMKPTIFHVRSVKPIIAGEVEEKSESVDPSTASVRFEFMDEVDREYFLTYALPMLPGFTAETSVRGDNLYCATLTYDKPETAPNQIARINAVFNRIMDQFGSSSMKSALLELRDKRFPTEPYPPGQVADRDWSLDHCRDYRVTKETMDEALDITDSTTVLHPVKKEELEAWHTDPAAQKGKQAEKYQQNLEMLLRSELREQPVDNAKLKPLMHKALSTPGFNLVKFMQNLNVND